MSKLFRVEVSDEHGQIVAIEHESLAGRDIGESERETIGLCVENLIGFSGYKPDIVAVEIAERDLYKTQSESLRERNAALVKALEYARRMMKPDSDTAYVDAAIAKEKS